jgi:hypothetical protein
MDIEARVGVLRFVMAVLIAVVLSFVIILS